MRVQLIKYFEGIKECKCSLWQIFTVKEVQVRQIGRKYPSNCKYYLCYQDGAPLGTILFDYTEVKEID